MKLLAALLLFITVALTGCDTISGVSRSAMIHALPDLPSVKARIESYPEIKEVNVWKAAGGRPLTLTGIKNAEERFYLSYTDRDNVRGTLMFTRDYRGQVSYSQYLIDINRRPPQAWIDATWPVMKKVEQALIDEFRFPEIRASVKCSVFRVEDPERTTPHQPPAPTRGSS